MSCHDSACDPPQGMTHDGLPLVVADVTVAGVIAFVVIVGAASALGIWLGNASDASRGVPASQRWRCATRCGATARNFAATSRRASAGSSMATRC